MRITKTPATILILYPASADSDVADLERRRKLKKYRGLALLLRDAGVAVAMVSLVLLAMYAYTGQWPPLVVIESNSMMHGDDNLSHIGTIDTGDLVLVQKVDSVSDIVTYAEGFVSGHRTYGDYGDVIVYNPDGNGLVTPIIHRAMIFLQANSDGASYRSESLRDLPAEKWSVSNPADTWDHLTSTLYIIDVGYGGSSVAIDIGSLGTPLRNGFITKGDHNPTIDQPYRSRNIELDWIVGKARGEIPWFGLLKLWSTHTLRSNAPDNSVRDLWICIAVIVIAPILVDIGLTFREKRRITWKKAESREEEARSPSDEGEGGEKDGG
jgi:signal peptidase